MEEDIGKMLGEYGAWRLRMKQKEEREKEEAEVEQEEWRKEFEKTFGIVERKYSSIEEDKSDF